MKYLKTYEEFLSKKVNFIKPAFEIKEFWRIFKELPETTKKLGFDLELFKEEPEIFERHEDPVFDDKLSTEYLKKKVDKKYIPFIDKCEELLNSGKLVQFDGTKIQKIATDSNAIKRGDFSDFLKEKDFLEDRKKAYDETMEIMKKNNETNIYASGLISKYPELKDILHKAQSYLYYKDSWDKFDEKIEKGDSIQASSILVIDGKYIILGGNRRMAYYIVSKINPMIWVINLNKF
jgi:anaerobic selenocysteine-containing dehydrogenase